MFKFYEVGGKIRDELLGLKSKDVDYVAVPSVELLEKFTTAPEMFAELVKFLEGEKFKIFLITPEFYTIRAMFPEGHKYQGVADFVMARKEIGYIEGTRNPIVVPGTLYDDLVRRDFTVNAMAKDENGIILDVFNGKEDLKNMVLRTPLPCKQTFDDDPLRILRAVRFVVTKGFKFSADISDEIYSYDYLNKMGVVSEQRIREELQKMFKHDTLETIETLNMFPRLKKYVFKNTNLWLKPTFEE